MVVRGEAMQCKAKDSGMCLVSGGVVVGGCDSWSPEWPGLLVVGSSLPAQAPRRRGSRQQSEHAERERASGSAGGSGGEGPGAFGGPAPAEGVEGVSLYNF